MQHRLFTSTENWITLEYCILIYCMWMVDDLPHQHLATDWWREVIIEIDKPPKKRKAQLDIKPGPKQLSLF